MRHAVCTANPNLLRSAPAPCAPLPCTAGQKYLHKLRSTGARVRGNYPTEHPSNRINLGNRDGSGLKHGEYDGYGVPEIGACKG